MHDRLRLVSSFALLVLFGCGDDDRPRGEPDGGSMRVDGGDAMVPGDGSMLDAPPMGDAGTDAGPAIDGGAALELIRTLLCEPVARASCVAPWSCGCPDIGPPPDEASCTAEQVAACVDSFAFSETGAAVAAGRATIDAEALERCGRRYAGAFLSCSVTEADLVAWCLGAFVDRAPLGSPCTGEVYACAGGAGTCGFGTCTALPGRGSACSDAEPLCAPGLVCHAGTCTDSRAAGESCASDHACEDDLLCVGGTCAVMRVALGSACSGTAECVAGAYCTGSVCTAPSAPASCDDDGECGSLSLCESAYESRCTTRVPAGARCYSEDHCQSDAYCDFTTELCVSRPGLGAPCPFGYCAEGLTCGGDGTCRTLGNEGETCTIAFADDGCQPSLSCVAGVCSAMPNEGAACADDGECADGLECIFTPAGTSVCSSPRNSGEACDGGWDGNDCYDGLFCDFFTSTTCVPRRGPGEACFGATDECTENHDCIYDDTTGASTCQPLPSTGELCSTYCLDPAVCVYGPAGGRCTPRICSDLVAP